MKIFGKDAAKSRPQRSTQGEQLAKALNWIITDHMFAEVVLYGNIDWMVAHLVRVAVLWSGATNEVWSFPPMTRSRRLPNCSAQLGLIPTSH